jgi:hypothetical protein
MEEEMDPKAQLLNVYSELSKTHANIMGFRAKLLTLLPLASGAGVFLLLQERFAGFNPGHMIAIGVFGAVVTLGLYQHELINIRWCDDLWERGSRLEKAIFEGAARFGLFHGDPEALAGLVGARGAALTIFPVTLGAWTYVAVTGLAGGIAGSLEAWVASAVVFLVFYFGGWWVVRANAAEIVARADEVIE